MIPNTYRTIMIGQSYTWHNCGGRTKQSCGDIRSSAPEQPTFRQAFSTINIIFTLRCLINDNKKLVNAKYFVVSRTSINPSIQSLKRGVCGNLIQFMPYMRKFSSKYDAKQGYGILVITQLALNNRERCLVFVH